MIEAGAPAGVGSYSSGCVPGCFQHQRGPSMRHLARETPNHVPRPPKYPKIGPM